MKKIIGTLFAFILGFSLFANDLPTRPNPPTLVTDYANVFSKSEVSRLERKLVDYFAATSTQIAVVTVPTLDGNDISSYAFNLGEAWGIGNEKFNNGILVLLKPKTSSSRGEAFIAVGYGLEGAVPDITAKQIVENEMIPRFKMNDMYGGIDDATNVLIDITKGEYNYQQYAKRASSGGFNPFVLIFLIFLVFPMLFGRRKRGMYSTGGRSSSLPFWLAMGMMSGGRRSHSGFYNDFNRGSGSFGGGGGSFGSFGGFGGGGFGGGGAGGSW